jgi:CBS domain-containing protein
MQIRELMSRDVATITPGTSLRDAARRMAALNVGALPVSDKERLVGMITDRDIAVRGVAEGKTPSAKVRDVMTPQIKYCFDDQELDEIAANMADIQVRRLPVVDRDKRLVGILSLGDIAVSDDTDCAIEALSGISRSNGGPVAFLSL